MKLEATEYGKAFECECGCSMLRVLEVSATEKCRMRTYLTCSNPDCPHHGKRFAAPTVELREVEMLNG